MTEEDQRLCPLCGRPLIPGPSVDEHHLVPKLKGGRGAEPVHRVCHSKIHATWDENTLRDEYNTWEKIREAPEMQSFIRWVRKKPPEFRSSSKMVRGHKRKKRR